MKKENQKVLIALDNGSVRDFGELRALTELDGSSLNRVLDSAMQIGLVSELRRFDRGRIRTVYSLRGKVNL